MAPPSSPDDRVGRRALRHHGLVTRAWARECGLSDRQIAHRVAKGRWIRIAPGVYRVNGAPTTATQAAYAAVLAAGAGAIVGGRSALALLGLVTAPTLPQITVPSSASGRTRVALVRRCDVGPEDRTTVGPIPCATPARALVEMARRADQLALAEALDTTLHRQLASPASVLASLRRAGAGPGRAGAAMLRAALDPWLRGIEPGSPAEVRLLRRLGEWGFPPPQLQHEVVTPAGRFRLDVAWPALLAALEYDGVEHHGPRQLAADVRREEALRAAGWWIGRVDRHDLAPSSTRVRDELVERLAARAS